MLLLEGNEALYTYWAIITNSREHTIIKDAQADFLNLDIIFGVGSGSDTLESNTNQDRSLFLFLSY